MTENSTINGVELFTLDNSFDALFNKLEAGPGRSGGGRTMSGNSPINVAIAILRAAPRALNGVELTCHARGLGLWQSTAQASDGVFVAQINDHIRNAKIESEKSGEPSKSFFSKPAKGLFGLTDNAPAPLAIEQASVNPRYLAAVESGKLVAIDTELVAELIAIE